VLSGAIRLWMVFAVALVFGTLTALDNPARLAFISEMVGDRLIRNAVTLNSTLVNVGRAIGPVVAATLVSAVGVGWCFVANAVSFGAVIASLVALNVAQLHPSAPVRRGRGQLRQGLAYARTVQEILVPVAMMALIGTLTYEYEVSLPLFGSGALHGGPTTYSALFAGFGFGSVVSTREAPASDDCVSSSSPRLVRRSTITPAYGVSKRTGPYRAAVASPSQTPEWVSASTSTACATVSVHEPTRLIVWLVTKRRKLGTANAASERTVGGCGSACIGLRWSPVG
jgi:hypothetical protein